MSLPPPSFASRGAFTACALLAFGLLASEAQARSEVLRFSHSRSDVQSFDARVQDATGNATERSVNLGLPSQDGSGTYFAEIDVEGDVLVSLSATGPSDTSHWSAPRLFEGPPRETPSTIPVGAGVSITPTAGAVARMDFGTSAGGPFVDGWLDTQRDFSLSQDDSLFSTITLGGNRMLHTNSTDLDIHAHVSGGGNPWANIEVRGRMATDDNDASIGITTYSGYPATDAYYRLGRSGGESFRLEGRPRLACSSNNTGFGGSIAGRWIRFELDVEENAANNRIRAKVWFADEPGSKPVSPQIDCTDNSASRPRNGTIGVWSGGDGNKFWDDLEVFQGVGNLPTSPPAPPTLLQIIPVQ
jgi:hypothetical protein